jgi:hypothetical protein
MISPLPLLVTLTVAIAQAVPAAGEAAAVVEFVDTLILLKQNTATNVALD